MKQSLERLVMIIKGNFKRLFGINKDLYNERYSFCKDCPFNSKNTKELTTIGKIWHCFGEYCTECGCPLKSKLVEPLSECPELKWGQKLNK